MQFNSAYELKLRAGEATATMVEDILWAKFTTIPHPDSQKDWLEVTVFTHDGERIRKVL